MSIENNNNSTKEIQKIKIVPVENIIPDINTDKLTTIEEQLKKIGDDDSSRKKLEFGSPQGTPYGSFVESNYRTDENIRKAFEKFKDQIVIELAAGWIPCGYYLANIAGAKAYIAEEPYWPDKIAKEFNYQLEAYKYKNLREIPVAIVPEDMLTFLKRLPDNSVSIFTTGIDEAILEYKYMELVKKEMTRVLSKNGAIIAYEAYLQPTGLENERIYLQKNRATFNILTKNPVK